MIALAHVSPFPPVLVSLGLVVTIATAVLVAHWGAFRPRAKRMITAGLIACSLSTVGAVVVRADDPQVDVQDICARLEEGSLLWILEGCWLPRSL